MPFEYDSYTAAELSSPTATKTSTATTQYTHPPQPQSQQISVPPATPPVTAPVCIFPVTSHSKGFLFLPHVRPTNFTTKCRVFS